MTQVITSRDTANRIKELNKKLEKEHHYIWAVRIFRKQKRKDINERLQLNWDRLYEFYPGMECIHNVDVFLELINSNLMPNRIRSAVVGSKIYDINSKEWQDLVAEKIKNL